VKLSRRAQDGLVLALGLLPLAGSIVAAAAGWLGANPVEELTHQTGEAALRLLLLSLCVTPARRIFGWHGLARHRRTLGLFAFFYASLHLGIYVFLDLSLDFTAVAEDLLERPYIAAGFTAFVSMLPLALTSTRAAIRRLGSRWRLLHRLVYPAAVAAVVHRLWLAKADLREPLLYAAILAVLLGVRGAWHLSGGRGGSIGGT